MGTLPKTSEPVWGFYRHHRHHRLSSRIEMKVHRIHILLLSLLVPHSSALPLEHSKVDGLAALALRKHLDNLFEKRGGYNDDNFLEEQNYIPMLFSKRAPMRFGKRNSDTDLTAQDYSRSIRAPMRFGKRYVEQGNYFEVFTRRELNKRAPMRFGKRNSEIK